VGRNRHSNSEQIGMALFRTIRIDSPQYFYPFAQNELFSLFHFIKVEPYGDESWWNHVIMKPIRSRDERGLERLRSVLSAVLLRRTKDQKMDGKNPVVDLPPRTVNIHLVELDEKENDFYQQLWLASKETFRSMMAEGTVLKNYAHILEILLRLRQACDHPVLVINDRQRRLQRSSQDKKSLQRVRWQINLKHRNNLIMRIVTISR